MSLMTQSLKRIAGAHGGRLAPPHAPHWGTWPDRDEEPRDEWLDGREVPSSVPPPTPTPTPEICVPETTEELPPDLLGEIPASPLPSPESPVSEEQESSSSSGSIPETEEVVPAPAEPSHASPLAPCLAELQECVLRDVGSPAEGDGKVIALVSVQAAADLADAVQSLSQSLLGVSTGVLAMDTAASSDFDELHPIAGDGHGFTSLLDGTRNLEEVLVATEQDGLSLVRTGLSKGEAQAVDPSAIEALIQDCRQRFSYTVIGGGEWQAEYLPITAKSADAVYLVIRAHVTEQVTALAAMRHLDRLGLHVRGCILTGTRS